MATNKWARYAPPGERFNFAGFTFPRMVADMACGPAALRKKYELRQSCGPYYHAPTPNQNKGRGFYLGRGKQGDGQPFARWQWADEVEGVSISHTGWYTDEHGDSELMRGLVARLPHGRFLAGWSMGEGMASSIDATLYDDEREAAYAADRLAESAAERERDYQREEQERMEQEEREEQDRQRELETDTRD